MSFKTEFLQLIESISNAGVNLRTLLAGLIGSIVAVQWGGNRYTLGRRLMLYITGCFASYYMTPIVMNHMNIIPEVEPSIGFMLGLFGMRLYNKVVEYLKNTDLEDLNVKKILTTKNKKKNEE
jgi:hypothetical protein